MEMKKSYYAIIPANVRYDTNLTANAKLLYGEITALCNEKGYCWAENKYFADLYSVSKTSVSKWVKSLIDGGYINSRIIYKEGSKEIEARYLTIVNAPIEEKLYTPLTNVNDPIEEKLKDNNTLNNTFNNTFNNIEKERKKAVDGKPANGKSNYDVIIDEMVFDDEVKQALYEFIKMRKLNKSTMTDYALKLLINKLYKLSTNPADQVKMLNNAIEANWKSVYALQSNGRVTNSNANSNPFLDLMREEGF